MKFLSVLVIALFSSASMAHLKTGAYQGMDEINTCTVFINSVVFKNDVKHPLNEVVGVNFEGQFFALTHPAIVDVSAGTIKANKDELSGVVTDGVENMSFILYMSHVPGFEGPNSFSFIKTKANGEAIEQRMCLNLVYKLK